MGDTQGRRMIVAITGAVSALVALAWIVAVYSTPGIGTATSATSASPLDYAIPLLSLLSIVGTTWYLLKRKVRSKDTEELQYVRCVSCGRTILQEWRLCPYCGSRSEARAADEDPGRI